MRVQGPGFRVQGSGSRIQGSGSRVHGSWFMVHGAGCRVQGTESFPRRRRRRTHHTHLPRIVLCGTFQCLGDMTQIIAPHIKISRVAVFDWIRCLFRGSEPHTHFLSIMPCTSCDCGTLQCLRVDWIKLQRVLMIKTRWVHLVDQFVPDDVLQ